MRQEKSCKMTRTVNSSRLHKKRKINPSEKKVIPKLELGDLFVLTSEALLRLDLKNYEFDPATASESGEKLPRPEICFTYDDAVDPLSPPLGRNVMKLGSNVYFVGGASKKIYQYDPSTNSCEESVLRFNEVKDQPAVEEIDGKIYVFHRVTTFPWAPNTSLEVLDPSSPNLSWEKLPDPDPELPSLTPFVLHNKLYALTPGNRMYYFDVTSKKWGTDDAMFRYKCFMNYQIKVPRLGRRVCEDIMVAPKVQFDRDNGLRRCFVYGYLYSKDSILLGCQKLGDVFGEHQLCSAGSYFHLIAIGDGKFCAIAIGPLFLTPFYYSDKVLGVSVFNVTKLRNAEKLQAKIPAPEFDDCEQFLSLSIEKIYFFDLRRTRCSSQVSGAFFA